MREPKDPRSTGRKRGRRVLEKTDRDYRCECPGGCGSKKCSATPESICGYTPMVQGRADTLDVNHKNKNVLDNDPANLEWLCRPCHRAKDRRTAKGEEHAEELAKRLDDDYLRSFGL